MKAIIKLLPLTLLFLVVITHADDKNAVMLEKVDDPFAGMASIMGAGNLAQVKSMMGDKSKAKNYKHCIQNISGDKEFFKKMAAEMTEEAVNNGQYNDIKSVTLIEKCPVPANGICDHGSRVEYFYNNSVDFLSDQKEGCDFFKKKWTTFDISGVMIKTQKRLKND